MKDLYRIDPELDTHAGGYITTCLRCMIDLHIADGELVKVVPDYEAAKVVLARFNIPDEDVDAAVAAALEGDNDE